MAVHILLHKHLGERRWTQAQLARKTGIRPNTICDLYNETTTRVDLRQIEAICKALNITLSELIEFVPDKRIFNQ